MLNENRFLGTFRGHNTRTNAFCPQNKRKQLQFKTTFINISEKGQSLTIAVYN
jgi:hypothetical protein